jgi:hypothetical protein
MKCSFLPGGRFRTQVSAPLQKFLHCEKIGLSFTTAQRARLTCKNCPPGKKDHFIPLQSARCAVVKKPFFFAVQKLLERCRKI